MSDSSELHSDDRSVDDARAESGSRFGDSGRDSEASEGDREFSRRHMLGLGAAAGAAIAMHGLGGSTATSPHPGALASDCTPNTAWPLGRSATMVGFTNDTTAYVSAYVGDAAVQPIKINYWDDHGGPVRSVTNVQTSQYGLARGSVTSGLLANSWYNWQAMVGSSPKGQPARGKTLPPAGAPTGQTTLKIAGLTCQDNADSSMNVPNDILEWAPDFAIHMGDDGYPNDLNNLVQDPTGATHQKCLAVAMTDHGRGKINTVCGIMKRRSDHDTNGYCDTGGNNPNYQDGTSLNSLQTWNAWVPVPNEDLRQPPTRSAGGSWFTLKTGNYFFFFADTRSQERTNVLDGRQPDEQSSTMLGGRATGSGQYNALLTAITYAANNDLLFIFVCDPGWMGTAETDSGGILLSNSDKWCAYTWERDVIDKYWRDAFLAHHAEANVVILHGDTHAAQNGKTDFGGATVVSVGQMDNKSHALDCFRHNYLWTYPRKADDSQHQLWTRITLADDGNKHITLTTEPRVYDESLGRMRFLQDSDSGGALPPFVHAQVVRTFDLNRTH